MKTYIAFLPVGSWYRQDLEYLENTTYDTYNEMIASILNVGKNTNTKFNIYSLSDFMDICNGMDDDITLEMDIDFYNNWCVYINVDNSKKDTAPIENKSFNLSVSQLIVMLKKYPPNMGVTTEQNQQFVHIVNDEDRVILSTTKPIGTCNRTGTNVYPSIISGYSAFNPELDEDLITMEWTPNDLFGYLDRIPQPLRSLIEAHSQMGYSSDDAERFKQVCNVYDYTFDIDVENENIINLRKM